MTSCSPWRCPHSLARVWRRGGRLRGWRLGVDAPVWSESPPSDQCPRKARSPLLSTKQRAGTSVGTTTAQALRRPHSMAGVMVQGADAKLGSPGVAGRAPLGCSVMPILLAQGTRPCSSFWVLAGPEDSAPTLGVTGTAPPELGLSNRCHTVGRVQQPLSWDGNGAFGFKPRDEEVTQTVVQTFLSPLSP